MRITEKRRLVIEMVEDVRIKDFKLSYGGRRVTSSPIVRALEEPYTAAISISIVRAVHEIWVMSLMIEALGAEVVEGRLKVRGSPEEPAAVLRTHFGTLTLWYQFPRYGPNRHGKLLSMYARNERKEEVKNILALKEIPENYKECVSAVNKENFRPDIVIAKGSFKFANDIRTETEDRVREKAVVIDPKIEIREKDVKQLQAYTYLFPEGSKFICPCLNGVTLRPSGWDVIEDVRPEGEGINRFRESVRDAV